MTKLESALEKCRILSGSALKVIAVITMLIDHLAWFFARSLNTVVLLSAFGHVLTLYRLLRGVGRLAFPLFAFLITEGFQHTRNRRRYGISLALFALLSEIPFDLYFEGKLFSFSSQNVFFTLFFGYLALCMLEQYREKHVVQVLWLIGLFAASLLLRCDYGCSGYCFILFLYVMRERKLLRAVIGAGFLSSRWQAGLAFIPIAMYNGKRGFIRGNLAKYGFYVFYPLHFLILYWIRTAFFL